MVLKSVFFWYILQSAIFNFQSLLTVILLLICTCAYIRAMAPSLLDKNKTGYYCILVFCVFAVPIFRLHNLGSHCDAFVS